MSQEREVLHVSKAGGTLSGLIGEDIKNLSKAQLKAKLVGVLSRIRVIDKGAVQLKDPDNVYVEWAAKYPKDIHEMKMQGFEFAEASDVEGGIGVTHNGDGTITMGDAVLMKCPKIVKEALEEIRMDEHKKRHGKKKKQREEQDYSNLMGRDEEIGATIDSEAEIVNGEELKQRLSLAEANGDPDAPMIDPTNADDVADY